MTIQSGPTKERLIRIGIFALICAVMCVLFLYDAFSRYPAKNAKQARDDFPEVVTEVPQINPQVTKKNFEKIKDGLPMLAQAKEILGEPAYESDAHVFWVGPAGYVRATLEHGTITLAEWPEVRYKRESLLVQKVLGVLAGLVAIPTLVVLFRVLGVKAILDEHGLAMNPGESVAWDQMTSLDASRYKGKGWVTLRFEREGGSGELRLDSYHLARFNEIVVELCRRKGFESPVRESEPADSPDDPDQA